MIPGIRQVLHLLSLPGLNMFFFFSIILGIICGNLYSLLTPFFITPESPYVEQDSVYPGIFHSPEVFKLNYAQMEREFKIFVYSHGDPNTLHQMPSMLGGNFASEGFFFKNIEESQFLTKDPNAAHLFFIPFSFHKMGAKGASSRNMTASFNKYVESLILKYPYWNRTQGADHFLVSCHDICVKATEGIPNLAKNSIRVVCSPYYDSDFIPHKDVSLPQIQQPFVLPAGGNDFKNRTSLALWAGYHNSKLRGVLARFWPNDELEILTNEISTKNSTLLNLNKFHRSMFCICPGYPEGNLVQIADSIHYGCVPVILSDLYDLPCNDILDWQKFSVVLNTDGVYQLQHIMEGISSKGKFITLHKNIVKAQRHFQWNTPPIKYDAFHMVMYELWLRRHVIKY